MSLEIQYAPEFQRDYKKLNIQTRRAVKERGCLFQQDPFHPLLKTHKLAGGLKDCFAFSVDFRVRVIFQFLSSTEVMLLRVGDHSIYRKR